jgi:hypothetical protein
MSNPCEATYNKAMHDIRMFCEGICVGDFVWYDLSKVINDGDVDAVANSVAYLDSYKALVQHPYMTSLHRLIPFGEVLDA